MLEEQKEEHRLFLSHFLFQLLELARGGIFARGPIHVRLQQLVLKIRPRSGAAGLLDVPPRPFGTGLRRPGGLELGLHVVQLPLRQRELFTLGCELALEDADALPMLGSESFRDRDRLLILDLPGEPAAPLRIREPLPLHGQLSIGARDRLLDLLNGDPGVDDRFAHLAREGAQIWSGRRVEGSAERIPQALEQVSDLA